ncbi:cuticle protein 7 [Lepeophtheirus salmonis]|uniref:cuticle protein 7 n=1 Tax=Lepeophtheirus salmonis TaxID=72036 RepID=UPI001AE627DE|nr:cuticle protein 7-like [Lepeophtheirus salmonis]
MLRYIIACTLLAFAYGDHTAPYAAPYNRPAPVYIPSSYDESPKPYAFQYGVADDYTGSKFSAEENSDAKTVAGSYQVTLPDGRIQTVTYTADDYAGFIADVKYEGIPFYPKYEPKSSSYKPAPVYKPPTYHA